MKPYEANGMNYLLYARNKLKSGADLKQNATTWYILYWIFVANDKHTREQWKNNAKIKIKMNFLNEIKSELNNTRQKWGRRVRWGKIIILKKKKK